MLRPEKYIFANLQRKNELISLRYLISCQIFLFNKKPNTYTSNRKEDN